MAHEITLILEWENVLLAERERCWEGLQTLERQILSSRRSVEFLVLYNPDQVDEESIRSAMSANLSLLDYRIIPAQGMHYYQLKNFGVREADGELIVFMDTDVIPEDGWFSALTEPFWAMPEIQVLAGHTYLEPEGFVARAFALGWFFPLRSGNARLVNDARHFFANNVAFRRSVFMQYPFPEMAEGQTRGACTMLCEQLLRSGVRIWRNEAAKASHPAPNGIRHVALRGLAEGRDWAVDRRKRQVVGWRCGIKAFKRAFSKGASMARKTFRHGPGIGLPYWQAPFAIAFMFGYYMLSCFGAWLFLLAPDITRRMWRI